MIHIRTLLVYDPDSKAEVFSMWQTQRYCWVVFCANDELRGEMNRTIERGHTAWVRRTDGNGEVQQHTPWDHPEFLKRIGEDMKRQFKFEYKLAERGAT